MIPDKHTRSIWQTHITELAKSLKCDVRQAPKIEPMMYVEFEPPLIEGPTIREELDYFYLLHELGHVAHGHTQGRPPYQNKRHYFDNGVLKSEAQAWEWALDNALHPPCQSTRLHLWTFALGSYYHASERMKGKPTRLPNGNRNRVEFVFDEPDDYFWKVARRLSFGK